MTLGKSVSEEKFWTDNEGKRKLLFYFFFLQFEKNRLTCASFRTTWTSTFSRTDSTSPRSTALSQGHSHSSRSSKSGRFPQLVTIRDPRLTPERRRHAALLSAFCLFQQLYRSAINLSSCPAAAAAYEAFLCPTSAAVSARLPLQGGGDAC